MYSRGGVVQQYERAGLNKQSRKLDENFTQVASDTNICFVLLLSSQQLTPNNLVHGHEAGSKR